MSATNTLFGGTKMMGVCYSPYHQAVSVEKSSYTKEDIDADLAITAKHFTFIRTYTVQFNQKYMAELCDKHSLGLAQGAWIFQGDETSTNAEIDTALATASAYPNTVRAIVIGNEVDLPKNNYNFAEVKRALNYALTAKHKYTNLTNVPVTVCMTGTGPANPTWSPLLPLVQGFAFLTLYPWYAPNTPSPGDISANMEWSYNNGLAQAEAAGLQIVIAEIGWPSDGASVKGTTWANEVTNFKATCAWINGDNIYKKSFITMWFEMFDEPWKTAEGAWGPHWGIYGSGKKPVLKSAKGVTFKPCD